FAFFDIDNTLTGSSIEDTNLVREKLRNLGYAVCFVTARTEEALMSKSAYLKSRKHGFRRPRPQLKTVDGVKKYVDPKDYEPDGIIYPDVIAGSTGTKILLRQECGGYSEDMDYTEKLGVSSKRFRDAIMQFISF